MPEAREAVIVIDGGPAAEHGWLGLRMALALGLAGCEVTVVLRDEAILLAARELDARAWLGGDPRADLDGLLGEAGARVVVAERSMREAAASGTAIRAGLPVILDAELLALLDRASVVTRL